MKTKKRMVLVLGPIVACLLWLTASYEPQVAPGYSYSSPTVVTAAYKGSSFSCPGRVPGAAYKGSSFSCPGRVPGASYKGSSFSCPGRVPGA